LVDRRRFLGCGRPVGCLIPPPTALPHQLLPGRRHPRCPSRQPHHANVAQHRGITHSLLPIAVKGWIGYPIAVADSPRTAAGLHDRGQRIVPPPLKLVELGV